MKKFILAIFLIIIPLNVLSAPLNPDENLPEYLLTYSMPNLYTIYQNETGIVEIKLKNEGTKKVNNITIGILGIPYSSYTISPDHLSSLSPDESVIFMVSINAEKIIQNKYTLNIEILSNETHETAYSTLDVREYTREIGKIIEEQERIENEVKPILMNLKPVILGILAGIFVAVTITATIMLKNIRKKTCPLCGGKVVMDYDGYYYTGYKCDSCGQESKVKKR